MTKKAAVSVKEFCEIVGVGRTLAYELIRRKEVEVRKVNRRTLILMRSVEALLGLNEGQR